MTNSLDKIFIATGSLIGSIILFTTSLTCINDSLKCNYKSDDKQINKLIVVNGATMFLSSAVFCYITHAYIKN